MSNTIPQIDINAFSSAIGNGERNEEDFVVFEGSIPPPKWRIPLRQSYYPLLCMEAGVIQNIVDLQPYELRKNDVLFLKPSQIIQVRSISDDARGKIIAFEKSFLTGENGYLPGKLGIFSPTASPVFALSDDEAQIVLDGIHAIYVKVTAEEQLHRRQIAINLISSLLLEIDAFYQARHVPIEKTLTRKEKVYNHFHTLLSAHFLHERTVMFYAEQLSITPKYLTELTKEFAGKTAGELIDDRVTLEAKVLLSNPNLSIKYIADLLHFSDQFVFSKYFKNFAGISPSEYRNLQHRDF